MCSAEIPSARCSPHVFVDVTNDMQIAQDEMFTPIASILEVHGEVEALRVANDTQ